MKSTVHYCEAMSGCQQLIPTEQLFCSKHWRMLDQETRRRLREVKLFEVSPVTSWPAYRATSASVRHLADLVQVEEDTISTALRALTSEDGELTEEQRDLLSRAISARSPMPVGSPFRDALAGRLASLAA